MQTYCPHNNRDCQECAFPDHIPLPDKKEEEKEADGESILQG